MNWNTFWPHQQTKNKTATPKYRVTTDPDTPEESAMLAWIEKWHQHFFYFNNEGCGCCINFYEFDAPPEAIADLPTDLIELEPYQETPRPVQTGTPSSFSRFFRSTKI